MAATEKLKGVFFGWWLVAACVAILLVVIGTWYYAFAVFLPALEEEFGWSRTALAGTMSLMVGVRAVVTPVVGRLVDRIGPRRVMLLSLLPFSGSFLMLSFTPTLWYFYLFYTLQAVGQTGVAFIPVASLITRWFRRRRGMAMGITLSGSALGGLVVAPLTGYLIASLGWRGAFIALGLFSAVIVFPLVALMVRNRPEDEGLVADGQPTLVAEGVAAATLLTPSPRQWTPGQALRTRALWVIILAYILLAFGDFGVSTHLVVYITDMGISPMAAATALGFYSGFGLLGKVGAGYLADRLSKTRLAALSFFFMAVGLLLLMHPSGLSSVWLFTLFTGCGLGGLVILRPLLVAEFFGETSFGSNYSIVESVRLVGAISGPLLAGWFYDTTASYYFVFFLVVVGYLVSIGAVLSLRAPRT